MKKHYFKIKPLVFTFLVFSLAFSFIVSQNLRADETTVISTNKSALLTPEQSLAALQQQVLVAQFEAKKAYQISGLLLLAFIVITFYLISKINYRKVYQQKTEQALAVAEKARAEAEKLAQAKINFLARMSHEIRTPMNGVLGMAESLTFTDLTNEQKSLLSTLTDSAENLLVLLNDILDFAKMDAGKLTLESQQVNVIELAQRIINAFHYVEKEKNIQLSLFISEHIAPCYITDQVRLMQVLNNLISNAIKFTPEGKVELSLTLVKRNRNNEQCFDTLRFSVKDTGIGIDTAHQEQLFSPFVQADNQVSRKYGGTGLGLSISQEIINIMGGKIVLSSQLEEGSEFYFDITMPQAALKTFIPERRQKPRDQQLSNEQRFNGINVLVAEDNLINIKVLSAQLKRLNINADIAENGAQALTMHNNKNYDIIISDCHMPVMDGYELAKNLAQQKHQQRPWLLAISADAIAGTAQKCLAAGFDDYIAKPCTQEEITNKMHHALRKISDHA